MQSTPQERVLDLSWGQLKWRRTRSSLITVHVMRTMLSSSSDGAVDLISSMVKPLNKKLSLILLQFSSILHACPLYISLKHC